jgi:hypothetical protein
MRLSHLENFETDAFDQDTGGCTKAHSEGKELDMYTGERPLRTTCASESKCSNSGERDETQSSV